MQSSIFKRPVVTVQCEECGREGLEDDIGICGAELGTPDRSYICSDIVCPDCREGSPWVDDDGKE